MSQDQTSFGRSASSPVDGMAELLAAFADFAVPTEDAVHRADRAIVGAFIKQGRVDLGRRLVGETRRVQQIQHDLLSRSGQRRAGRGLGRRIAGDAVSRARRRCTLARETPSAAQAAAVMRLSGASATTACVKARRRSAPACCTAIKVRTPDNQGEKAFCRSRRREGEARPEA
jgi:hypothetical protein